MNNARFLKNVWPFFSNAYERVTILVTQWVKMLLLKSGSNPDEHKIGPRDPNSLRESQWRLGRNRATQHD